MKKTLAVWSQSLGCPKNRVDTERLLGSLGLPVRAAATPGRANLVFINTCAFIEPATRESVRAILDAIAKKTKLKKPPLLAVAGCLPGRYGAAELARELPEVDLWLHPANIDHWAEKIRSALALREEATPGRLVSSPSYAWLKIGDGCAHNCSFCVIPAIRGAPVCEPRAKILAEARAALAAGVKELVLVAQDITIWKDTAGDLVSLLEDLAALAGLRWLRCLYLYPATISENLLKLMAAGGPLLPYLDIPLQHCEASVLARMGRPFKRHPREIVAKIRRFLPEAALRASLIVGFPGETDADFQNLLNFVRETRFANLGVFTYHAEEGSRAAHMPDQIPENVKKARRDEIMRLQAEISSQFLAGFVGENLDVLVDKNEDEQWPGLRSGRVWFQAPEIDGVTYVSGAGVRPGEMVNCLIENSHEYDLSALANDAPTNEIS